MHKNERSRVAEAISTLEWCESRILELEDKVAELEKELDELKNQ